MSLAGALTVATTPHVGWLVMGRRCAECAAWASAGGCPCVLPVSGVTAGCPARVGRGPGRKNPRAVASRHHATLSRKPDERGPARETGIARRCYPRRDETETPARVFDGETGSGPGPRARVTDPQADAVALLGPLRALKRPSRKRPLPSKATGAGRGIV